MVRLTSPSECRNSRAMALMASKEDADLAEADMRDNQNNTRDEARPSGCFQYESKAVKSCHCSAEGAAGLSAPS